MKIIATALSFLCMFSAVSTAQNAAEGTLKQIPQPQIVFDFKKIAPHPRIIMTNADVAAIKERIAVDPVFKSISDAIISQADEFVSAPKLERIKIGRRLLSVSRQYLKRIAYLSYAYRLTEDKKYAAAAEREMLNAAEFSDWNPSHFLDTAEMSFALAIGYDWTFDALPAESRKTVELAIISKGIAPSFASPYNYWLKNRNNWNQVCNASVLAASLAVYENARDLCEAAIRRSAEANLKSFAAYAPDGVYPEGPGYWEYGTSFEVALIEMLRSAFGGSFGMEKAAGFLESSSFIAANPSPSGKVFNFSDGNEKTFFPAPMLWFALERKDASLLYRFIPQFSDPANTFLEHGITVSNSSTARLLPLFVKFAAKTDFANIPAPKNGLWIGRGECDVAYMRSGGGDSGIYLAIKGGRASLPHGHMDAGGFVLDFGKTRWVCDPKIPPYTSFEERGVNLWDAKAGGERWTLVAYGAIGHSTLTVNGKEHNPKGNAKIVDIFDSPENIGAAFDMTEVFAPDLASARREARILYANEAEIADFLKSSKNAPAKVRWNISTQAKATVVSDSELKLEQNGETVSVKIEADVPAKAAVFPYPGKNPNDIKVEDITFAGFYIEIPANSEAKIKVIFRKL